MLDSSSKRGLAAEDLEALLAVTSALAQPFERPAMLAAVARTARQVLAAERCSVWLNDTASGMLVLETGNGLAAIRIPFGSGIAGACALNRTLINVPDCQADARFDGSVDRASGYRTRCMLTLPLIDHRDALVGVMQILNKIDGIFDQTDEQLAMALAAQCAIALQRVQMTAALIDAERMREQLDMARLVQTSALPSSMPSVPGYEMVGLSRPAEQTGGDTFDLVLREQTLLIVLGDATGHGIAPALSVTQMQAMLRMAFRMGASLETAFTDVNNLLSEGLPDDRFITAFIGMLDTATHQLQFLSGGQGPIMHFHAADASFSRFKPTSFPLGAMPVTLARLKPAITLALMPGDLLVLLSDGIFEYRNASDAEFGESGVAAVIRACCSQPPAAIAHALLAAVQDFAEGAPQEDDMTIVLVKRTQEQANAGVSRSFARRIDALEEVFAFSAAFHVACDFDAKVRSDTDFIIEELFTNMVKYGHGPTPLQPVHIEMTSLGRGVEVILRDIGAAPFDVTSPSNVDPHLPIEERTPGGLGIYVVQRLADSLEYRYDPATRENRITFRITPDHPRSLAAANQPENDPT